MKTKESSNSASGFEIWKNQLKMSIAMHRVIFLICLAVWSSSTVIWVFKANDPGEFSLIWRYLWAEEFGEKTPNGKWPEFVYEGRVYQFSNQELLASPKIKERVDTILEKWKADVTFKATIAFGLSVILYIIIYKFFRRYTKKRMAPRHIRGTRLITERELIKAAKSNGGGSRFSIGNLPIPVDIECKSFFFVGSSGSGKTQAILPMISKVQESNQKGIVYDIKGDFTSSMHREGKDFIWNPLDARSLKWTIFNDIKSIQDAYKIAFSLLPSTGGMDATAHFRNAARDLFIACLLHCYQTGKRTNRDLWQLLSSSIPELAKLLKGSVLTEKGATHIQDSKQYAQSVVGSMMPLVSVIEYMPDGDFSVDSWVKDTENPNIIFIGNRPDMEDFLRPAMSLFVDFIGTRVLSMQDDIKRRIYFFMDEFPSLGNLGSLPKLLSMGRSKGFSGILAAQSNSQIIEKYGENVAAEIINGCATYAIYNLRDPKSAKYFADAIGQREVEHPTESTTYTAGDGARDGGGINQGRVKEHAVMAEELQALPELTFILKLANCPNPAKLEISFREFPKIVSSYIEREGMDIESLLKAAMEAKVNKPTNDSKEPPKDDLQIDGELEEWLDG